MAVQPTRYRFTRADYYRMAEAGILGEDDRVELIEGEIYRMSPIGPMHAGGVDRLNRLFSRTFGDAVIVRVQNPVVLDDYSEPEPDLTLLRPRADFYTGEHPNPEDILLAVEVADSSADWDRRVKAPLYARSGIPELWVLEVRRDHIAVYGDPTDDGYATTRIVRRGETIRPAAFPDLEIAVEDILGPGRASGV